MADFSIAREAPKPILLMKCAWGAAHLWLLGACASSVPMNQEPPTPPSSTEPSQRVSAVSVRGSMSAWEGLTQEESGALPPLQGRTGPEKPRDRTRRVGDVWVHRFSGSYRKEPILLREEVLERKGSFFVVDYVLSEGDKHEQLRVKLSNRTDRVVAVSKIENGRALPASLEDYETLIAKTTFVPERNDGRIDKVSETCLIEKKELDCEIASFLVQVDEEPATLRVARTPELERDLSGEVRAVDGTILYHAELVEMERGPERPEDTTASMVLIDWDPFLD